MHHNFAKSDPSGRAPRTAKRDPKSLSRHLQAARKEHPPGGAYEDIWRFLKVSCDMMYWLAMSGHLSGPRHEATGLKNSNSKPSTSHRIQTMTVLGFCNVFATCWLCFAVSCYVVAVFCYVVLRFCDVFLGFGCPLGF